MRSGLSARGLSPRMRGSPYGRPLRAADPGPIPAHAGEPAWRRARRTPARAYPRACGGATTLKLSPSRTRGLSPRMRGSQLAHGLRIAGPGPIPAHAGEPWARCQSGSTGRAYPRACGGAASSRVIFVVPRGLSPRMRGSLGRMGASRSIRGPIPAHAGEPPGGACPPTRPRAYPRACGGADPSSAGIAARKGLSPRMRGSRGCAERGAV